MRTCYACSLERRERPQDRDLLLLVHKCNERVVHGVERVAVGRGGSTANKRGTFSKAKARRGERRAALQGGLNVQ